MSAPLNNKNRQVHGLGRTRLYGIWKTMRQRCNNPNNCKYHRYGARGIHICDEWNNFKTFYDWSINNGYSENLSIDRIDNSKGYAPENCRWVDEITQANNKTNNVFIEYKGERYTMAQFCRKYNLKYKIFAKYYKNGLSVEDSFAKSARRMCG